MNPSCIGLQLVQAFYFLDYKDELKLVGLFASLIRIEGAIRNPFLLI